MSATVDHARAMERPTSPDMASDRISQVPYLPGLDGIRAVAVVAVMIYHANSTWLPGGFLGVEVFFVISGYLITLLLIAEHERTGRIDLKSFWIRRFRRLLPALFLMMLLLSVWVALFERDALGKLRGDVIAGASYFSNWYQIWIGAGYSAGSDFAPLRHLWSLAVEEQFYLVWPLVMYVLLRKGSRDIANVARWLFLLALVITVVISVLHYSGPQQTPELTPDAYWFIGDRAISIPDALYLSTLSRAGGLMLGSAFAMIWRPAAIMRGPMRTKGRLLDGVALVGFAALAWMSWTLGFDPSAGVEDFLFRGGLFLTGIASLCLIAAVTHERAITGRVLATPVLLWIGTRSYGLYLYHWPIYQIIRNIAANKLAFHEFVLAMVATCIITELSYRYVETPIRQGKLSELWHRARSPRVEQRRWGALAGVGVGVALAVFAGTSMATAELKQNELAEELDRNAAFVCDTLRDLDCDGVLDLDDDGNPLAGAESGADVDATDGAGAAEGVAGDGGEITVDDETGVVEAPDTSVAGDDAVTVPTSTEAPPAAASRIAVGDSVMKGAAQQLVELGFVVDAIESRAWVNGLDYVETLGRQGRLPDQLVIHLGTNGNIGQTNMDRMMAAVADVPQVLLITNDVDRDYTAANNALIYDAANRYDNVTLLDWQANVPACPGNCLYDDGFHLRPDGQVYYAALIAQSLGIA